MKKSGRAQLGYGSFDIGGSVELTAKRIDEPRRFVAYAWVVVGGPEKIRTSDTRFRKPLLYPLSYGAKGWKSKWLIEEGCPASGSLKNAEGGKSDGALVW